MPLVNGRMTGINWIASPNDHPGGNQPKYIIIHAMCGSLPGTESWFANPKSEVSAHFLVGKNGETAQMVRTTDTAWHCYGFNHCSVGIEHEDNGHSKTDPKWVTDAMLEASTNIAAALCKAYKIPVASIIEHCDPMIQAYAKKYDPSMVHTDAAPYFNLTLYRATVLSKLGGSQ